MRRPYLLLAFTLALAACGTDDGVDGESTQPAHADSAADTVVDTLTAAQRRDRARRAVGESGLPGGRVLDRAMDASEAANRRTATIDSMQQR